MPPDRPLRELIEALRAVAEGGDGLSLNPNEAQALLDALPNRNSSNAIVELTRAEVEAVAWAVWFSYPAARGRDGEALRMVDERLLFLRRQLLQG